MKTTIIVQYLGHATVCTKKVILQVTLRQSCTPIITPLKLRIAKKHTIYFSYTKNVFLLFLINVDTRKKTNKQKKKNQDELYCSSTALLVFRSVSANPDHLLS